MHFHHIYHPTLPPTPPRSDIFINNKNPGSYVNTIFSLNMHANAKQMTVHSWETQS